MKRSADCDDRFSYFRKLEVDFNTVCGPFNTVVDQSHNYLQLELIDLQ